MRMRLLSTFAAIASVSAVAVATPALAADLWGDREGSIKDAPYIPAYSWSGFYVGAHAGLGVGDTSGTPETIAFGGGAPIAIPPAIAALFATDYDMSGALYGGHVGYNFQSGSAVFGIEGSFSGSSINGDGPALFGFVVSERDVDWLATVTGRIGYAMGRSMVYAKAGVAFGDVSTNIRLGGITVLEGNETHVGWTIGAGFEHAIGDNISVRVEYAHVDLGSQTHDLANVIGPPGLVNIGSDVDLTVDTITLGVSFKFGGARHVVEPLK